MAKASPRARPAVTKRSRAASPARRVPRKLPPAPSAPLGAAVAAGPEAAAATASEPSKHRKRDKVIRDSFSMPRGDYELIATLKKRCIALGTALKKSELLRAGLAALQRMPDERLAEAANAVQNVKTGRPPGKKKKGRAKTHGQ